MKRLAISDQPAYLRYLLALILVAAATYLKIRFFELIGTQTPFLLYFGVMIVCSRWLGKGPAFFCLALSVIATDYFFMAPYYFFAVNFREAVQLLFFILEAFLLIGLSSALTKAIKANISQMELFGAIMEKSSDGIVVVDKEGKRTYCSPSVQTVIGYSAEEYVSFPAWKLGHPEEIELVKAQYADLVSKPGQSDILVHRMRHKDGRWIWVESRVTNSLDDPHLQAMIASFNDITVRIETEQSRKDFIGIVSHELKSPLTSIRSYGQILLKKVDLNNDPVTASIVSKVLQLGNRMFKIINDMLDVATINASQLKLELSNFDFNALIYEIADALQQTSDKHALNLKLSPPVDVIADRERVGQVLTNLVSNAIKYTPAGGDICILSEIAGSTIRLSVRDQGIGIPEQNMELIFNRLYRANNSKSVKGLGLGLFICKQIIQLHGGAIGLESEEGKGSTFWFTLPDIIKVAE